MLFSGYHIRVFSTVMLVIGAIVAHLMELTYILYWMEKRYSHNIPMMYSLSSGLTTFYLILGCVFVKRLIKYAVVPNQPFFEAEA
ncbi:hypothetical protein SPFM20_00075 [Salmonella phage SPFM20]|nr:hypothetical protein SPFM20_00075 [Salmonella phage SPFM20]